MRRTAQGYGLFLFQGTFEDEVWSWRQKNILFGNESEGVSEWKTIPQAEFNLFVGSWAGLDIVNHLKRKY